MAQENAMSQLVKIEKTIAKVGNNKAKVRESNVSRFDFVIKADWISGRTIKELQEDYRIHAIAHTCDGAKVELAEKL